MRLDNGPDVPVDAVLALVDQVHPDVLRAAYWKAAFLVQQQEVQGGVEQNGSEGGDHASSDDARSTAVSPVG